MGLAPGLRASVRIVVSQADTAIAAGSGDFPVLATPRLLALAEAAAVAAVAPQLAAGQTSVGTATSLVSAEWPICRKSMRATTCRTAPAAAATRAAASSSTRCRCP